tara:strand:+ start:166 stop:588 length:423 start_codon:yes stop_codon:yes gene_type:complete
MNYTVGQIIYLLSKKEVKVFPAQVVEEIKRKTIEKELISYVIQLPNPEKTEVLLEEITADVFVSLDDLEQKMVDNAHVQIKSFLQRAKEMEKAYPETVSMSDEPSQEEPVTPEKEGDTIEVDLGDGTKAKLSISELPGEA